MKSIPSASSARLNAGLSLIELQVAVAVIALLAAICVPQLPRLTEQARHAKGRQNAQSLALVLNAANAAGVEFSSLETALAEVGRPEGVASSTGTRYALSSLSTAELNEAKQYLSFSDGMFVYQPN